ncbi:MAG: hypothetical protein CW338_08065, partial [Clostridiales bacterium]|nr:hypothetical protein [Clostridiales bacterium]
MINGIMNTINISGPARITHSAGMPDTVIYCNSGNGSILHDGSVKPFTADDIVIIPSSEEAVLTGDTDLYLMSFDHLTPGFGHITVVTHEDNIRIKQLFLFVAGFDSHSPRVTRAVIPALG